MAAIIIGSAGNISPRSVDRRTFPSTPVRGGLDRAAFGLAMGIVQHRRGKDVLGLGMGRHAEARHVDADDAHAVDLLGRICSGTPDAVGTQRLVTTMAS